MLMGSNGTACRREGEEPEEALHHRPACTWEAMAQLVGESSLRVEEVFLEEEEEEECWNSMWWVCCIMQLALTTLWPTAGALE